MNYILVAIAIFAVWAVASLFIGSRIGRFIAERSVEPETQTAPKGRYAELRESVELAARMQ